MDDRESALGELWDVIERGLDEDWAAGIIEYCHKNPKEYGAEIGPALDRLITSGASVDDLNDEE